MCTSQPAIPLAPIYPTFPDSPTPFTMQMTTMLRWKVLRRTIKRYLQAESGPANYKVAYYTACGRTFARYQEAVAACHSDNAISTVRVMRPSVLLPGLYDGMFPHLTSCTSTDPTRFVADADGCSSKEPHTTPTAASFSSEEATFQESERAPYV